MTPPKTERVTRRYGRVEVSGYANVRCSKCGDNMPFFTGDLRWPVCYDCDHFRPNNPGNTMPSTPREIRRYHG